MHDHGIRQTVDALLELDPAGCDRSGLDQAVELTAKLRSWLDAVDVAIARQVRTLSTSAADPSPTEVLGNQGRRSKRESRAASERSSVCDRMPGFEEALVEGTVSAGHLDAIAQASRGLDDAAKAALDGFAADLVAAAKNTPVATFERDVRDLARFVTPDDGTGELERQKRNSRVSRWIDKSTGMWKLLAEVDPETGAKLWAALDGQLDSVRQREGNARVPLEQLAVTALVEVLSTSGSSSGSPRVPELYVHIDHPTLFGGVHPDTLCELSDGTPLPLSTVRRLCCDAEIVPIIIGPDGQPLDAGRSIRTANRKQRRLLRSMYRTCAHPHCDVPFDYCQIHHVIPWEMLGRTDMANLLPLCSRHHHLVHEAGWQLSMTPDRTITLCRPDGSEFFRGLTTDRGATRRTDCPSRDRPGVSNVKARSRRDLA